MNKKLNRYIFFRLLTITAFVLMVLIFIFLVLDFSENSDDFTDKGATMAEIFGTYYLNYIPEMIRLVSPLAAFVACLYLTGQMADRFEIISLKAAGISLYRLIMPYIVFALLLVCIISYLDGFVIPQANSERIAFENKYLRKRTEKVDRSRVYRQESENSIFHINSFDANSQTAYRVQVVEFKGDSVSKTMNIERMVWQQDENKWQLIDVEERIFTPMGFTYQYSDSADTTLNILPRDLARTTSDIYQLTYPQAVNYIAAIERSGASGSELPKIQFYGRLAYPVSILVLVIVGFAIASVRRPGGKGFHIASGLTISFLYLAFMKVIEPFGAQGAMSPTIAAFLPHLLFFLLGIGLLIGVRK